MINYILHVSLLLGLGFILYQVLLKKETFYSLNRVILAMYLVLAFVLPTIHIPDTWSIRNHKTQIAQVENKPSKVVTLPIDVNESLLEKSTKPKISSVSETNGEVIHLPNQPKKIKTTDTTWNIDWTSAIKWTYLIGLGIFLINFLVQFTILIYYRLKYPTLKDGKMTIVEMAGDKAPFSFLNMIYINPTKYEYETYEQILAHEKIHITKWHSADIFLSEIALIFQWFNPFAWYYRKAVEHNLEYLTDREMLDSGANAEVYQMNLLKVSVPELPLALSTNYNQSFLKKRIQMMNTKKSSAQSTWKYLFILPILGLTVSMINPTFSTAQQISEVQVEESSIIKPNNEINIIDPMVEMNIDSKIDQIIDPTLPIENLDPKLPKLSDYGISDSDNLTISTKDGIVSIVSDSKKSFTLESQTGRTIVKNTTDDIETKGSWEAEIEDNKVCIFIKKGGIGKNYYWTSSECMYASEFSPAIKPNSEGEFKLVRSAGTLILKGEFDGNEGNGRYQFFPDASYVSYIKQEGFDIQDKKMIHFFLSDVKKDYFQFLKKEGYNNLDEDELIAMVIHDVDEQYIMDINGEFQKVNYDKPSSEELVAMKIHDVDMEYIKSFGKELYEDLTVDQIISAAIHDVNPSYIKEFNNLGFDDLSFNNLISAAIHDVSPEYIKRFKDAGFRNLKFDDLISAAIHDVDTDYIKSFQAAGFKNLKFDNLISAAIHDVDVDYLQKAQSYGFDLTFDQLISASIHDVDLEYIKTFKDAGFQDLDFDDMISAAIHDVDPDYLLEAQSYGFDISFDQLLSASIHDIDLKYIEKFKNAGFKGLDFDDMISVAIHDIDPDYIAEFNTLGFGDLSFSYLITAVSHGLEIEYIKKIKNEGFKDFSFDKVLSANFYEIEPSFIKEVKNAGMVDILLDDILKFGLYNIDIEMIKGLRGLGFQPSIKDLIAAKTYDITPEFIKTAREKGFKDLSFDEYVDLKYYGKI